MNNYQKCKKEGHQFSTIDEDVSFDEYSATLECSVCEARVEVQGDVRTDDGRFIEWMVD